MKRKWLSLLLAVVFVVSCLPLSAGAAEIIDSGTCGDNLSWTFSSDGTLTISGTGSMEDYGVNSHAPWYSYREIIETVNIAEGITTIGGNAFSECSGLIRTTLPKSLTTIGSAAFYGCTHLTDITIPEGVTAIEIYTFSDCTGLTSIMLPKSLTTIGEGAFFKCSSLENISIPEGVTTIEGAAFSMCISLKNINIPDGVTTIAPRVFYRCSSLISVVLPKDLTTINDEAFCRCSSLENINIPDGVTTILYQAFFNCSSLTSITFPKSVTAIVKGAFNGCTSLKSATFMGNVPDPSHPLLGKPLFAGTPKDFCVYYAPGTTGWTTPSNGTTYPCKPLSEKAPDDDPDENNAPGSTQFTDVPANAYYEDAVKWAVENDITSGTSATKFSPNSSCTRGQIVTFLWRAAGEPEPTGSSAQFTDVKSGEYYEKAVQWAVEKGVTSGTSATTFSPNAACTRAQAVTFQWRAAGEPTASASSFTDVKSGAFYEDAVAWAMEKGVTSGTSATKFSPSNTCTRAQIVSFLYRDMGKAE